MTPLRPPAPACGRAAGPGAPIQLAARGAWRWSPSAGCSWPARCSAVRTSRSTASRRCPPTRCGRPPASSRARRCCGSTSTPPGRGSRRLPAGRLGRGHPRLAAHRRRHRGRAGAGRGRRARRAAIAGGRRGVLFDTVTGAPPAGVVPLDVPRPGPDDPATMAALAAIEALPRGLRDQVGVASPRPTRRGHHADPHRRHAGALGRPGGLRPQGAALAGAARADRRRRPGPGRRRSTSARRGRRPPLRPAAGVPSRSVCRRGCGRLPTGRPADTPAVATRPTRNISFPEFPTSAAHAGSGPRHETFPRRVVTPSGADVTNGSPVVRCDPVLPTRRPREGVCSGLSAPPNFVLVDQVDITVRLNLRMRVQLGSAA